MQDSAVFNVWKKKVSFFISLSKFTKVWLICFDILTIQTSHRLNVDLQKLSFPLFTLLFTSVSSLLVTVLQLIVSPVLCFIDVLCLQWRSEGVMWPVYVMTHVSFAFPSLHAKCKQAFRFFARIHSPLIKTYCFTPGRVWGCRDDVSVRLKMLGYWGRCRIWGNVSPADPAILWFGLQISLFLANPLFHVWRTRLDPWDWREHPVFEMAVLESFYLCVSLTSCVVRDL